MTRFDFNALQFIMSEDVQRMTDAERGQYVTLLCHAWLAQKECSLPNDPSLFARWCNCERVSENVLKKFEAREDGRLFNQRLLEDWNATVERVERASELSNRRWDKTKAADARAHTVAYANGNANAHAERIYQNDAQTKPTQTNPSQVTTGPVGQSQNPEDVFAEVRKKYHRIIGKSIGSLGTRTREWSGLVARHGSDLLLAAVVKWATDNKSFLKTCGVPIAHFLKNSSDYLDLAQIDREPETVAAINDEPVSYGGDDFAQECGLTKEEIERRSREHEAKLRAANERRRAAVQ